MPKTLHLATTLTLFGILGAAAAFAGEEWDHRAMQSHHQDVDRVEQQLAPGEKRVGRITIGAPAPSSTEVPETLHTATQRQWVQRSSFGPAAPGPTGNAPHLQAGRHEGVPGGHSTPSR